MKYRIPEMIALAVAAAIVHPIGAAAETIAVFTKNNTNPFSQAIRLGSNNAAVKLGARIISYVPTTPDSVAEQSELVLDAIASKPDAVLFDPVDNEKLIPAIEKLNAAGIPVTDVTDRAAGGKFVSVVLADDYRIGLATARRLLSALDGKGNVVILEGIAGNTTTIERLRGFNDALKEFPNVKLLASKSGNYQRRPAQDLMEAWIKAYPQIDGVIASNDSMAAAAVDVLDKRNRKALVVGINGSKEAVELIKAGKMLASGEFSGFVLGCVGTEIATRSLRNQAFPKELVLKPVIYDKANYQQYESRIESKLCPTLDEVTAD